MIAMARFLWLTTTTAALLAHSGFFVDARVSGKQQRQQDERSLQFVCYLCGDENWEITNPGVLVSVPTQGDVPCADLVAAGLAGFVEEALCPSLQDLAFTSCGCVPIGGNAEGTPAPTTPQGQPGQGQPGQGQPGQGQPGQEQPGQEQPGTAQPSTNTTNTTAPPATDPPVTDPPVTDPPVTDPPVTDPPATVPPATDPPTTNATAPPETTVDGGDGPFICNVCGDPLMEITIPDAMVDIPTQGVASCSQIVSGAQAGLVPDEMTCTLLVGLVTEPCGCAYEDGSTPPPEPTEPAVPDITPAPVPSPTFSPADDSSTPLFGDAATPSSFLCSSLSLLLAVVVGTMAMNM